MLLWCASNNILVYLLQLKMVFNLWRGSADLLKLKPVIPLWKALRQTYAPPEPFDLLLGPLKVTNPSWRMGIHSTGKYK